MSSSYVAARETAMQAPGASNEATIVLLVATGGRVSSPFLGKMEAAPFFGRLATASDKNVITPIDLLTSSADRNRAAACFRYGWTVADGAPITLMVTDLFRFKPGTDKVDYLDRIDDTHPIRAAAGNKYQA